MLGALWILRFWEFGIPGSLGVFFFSLGAVFAIKKISVYEVAAKLRYAGFVYPLLAVADVMTKQASYNCYIHNVAILSGMTLVWYGVGRLLLTCPTLKMYGLLSASTFFLFAVHEPYHGKFTAIFLKLMPTPGEGLTGDIMWTAYYFLWAALWSAMIVCLFAVIRRVSPKVATFLSGGR